MGKITTIDHWELLLFSSCVTLKVSYETLIGQAVFYAEQIRAARALLNWSQAEMAQRSGVSPATVKRVESADGPVHGTTDTVWRMKGALEDAGILFIDSDERGGPGARLRTPPRKSPRRKV